MYSNIFLVRAKAYGENSNGETPVAVLSVKVKDGKREENLKTFKIKELPEGEYNNFKIEQGKLVRGNGRATCDVDNGMVIIAELVNQMNDAIGYRVIRCRDGKIANVKKADIIRYVADGKIVLQNAMVVTATEDKAEHIRMYSENQVPVIKIGHEAKKSDEEEVKASEAEKLEQNEFTEAQLRVIKIAKEKYRIELTQYVDKNYQPAQMMYIMACLSDGYDVTEILDSRLSDGQMAEIIGGVIDGLDVSKYKDPKNSLAAMQKMHAELYREMWAEELY